MAGEDELHGDARGDFYALREEEGGRGGSSDGDVGGGEDREDQRTREEREESELRAMEAAQVRVLRREVEAARLVFQACKMDDDMEESCRDWLAVAREHFKMQRAIFERRKAWAKAHRSPPAIAANPIQPATGNVPLGRNQRVLSFFRGVGKAFNNCGTAIGGLLKCSGRKLIAPRAATNTSTKRRALRSVVRPRHVYAGTAAFSSYGAALVYKSAKGDDAAKEAVEAQRAVAWSSISTSIGILVQLILFQCASKAVIAHLEFADDHTKIEE